jgi:hypothetical protein
MVACKLINLGATVCQARTGFAAQPGGGIIAPPSSFNNVHHRTIVKQTIQHLLPAVLHLREAVLFGMRVLHTKASAGRGGWGELLSGVPLRPIWVLRCVGPSCGR